MADVVPSEKIWSPSRPLATGELSPLLRGYSQQSARISFGYFAS